MNTINQRLLFLFVALASFTVVGWCQSNLGGIMGRVTDPTGAASSTVAKTLNESAQRESPFNKLKYITADPSVKVQNPPTRCSAKSCKRIACELLLFVVSLERFSGSMRRRVCWLQILQLRLRKPSYREVLGICCSLKFLDSAGGVTTHLVQRA